VDITTNTFYNRRTATFRTHCIFPNDKHDFKSCSLSDRCHCGIWLLNTSLWFSFNVKDRGWKGKEVSRLLNIAIYCGPTGKTWLKATGTGDSTSLQKLIETNMRWDAVWRTTQTADINFSYSIMLAIAWKKGNIYRPVRIIHSMWK
jgi:hypothetical protein